MPEVGTAVPRTIDAVPPPKKPVPPPKPVQARVSKRSLDSLETLSLEDTDATDPNWLPPVDDLPEVLPRFRRLRSVGRTVAPLALVVFGGYAAFSLVEGLSTTVPVADASKTATPAVETPVAKTSPTVELTAAQRLLAQSTASVDKGGSDEEGGAMPREAEGASPELDSQLMPLPEGVSLAGDKGLLEINSGDKHKIYVAGVFVGRGPARRIPLAPGKHEIRTRLGADERTYHAVIEAGKRTRLEPTRRTAGC